MCACRERQRFGKSTAILQKRRRRRRKKSRGLMTTVVQGTYTGYHSHYSYQSLPTDINYMPERKILYIWIKYGLCSAATIPVIILTGRRMQGSTLSRPRRVWKWRRKAAAPRRMETRRGKGRKKEKRRKQTKTARYQRRRSQRRRARLVIEKVVVFVLVSFKI